MHLVTVWNPAYADAMDETLDLILTRVRNWRSGKLDQDDVYVWWGKVKSTNRQQRMPHLDDVLAIDAELQADPEAEVHLYITDYRSLFVGDVSSITKDDVRDDADGAVPSFYTKDIHCDCWFQLSDIRRIIADDTVAVVEELKKLSNTRYNDRPVSIYGGMVDLPLIVTRKDGARYFNADREYLTDGLLWVEFDAQRGGVAQMERELRENLIGPTSWDGLEPGTRAFIATAESIFRAGQRDRSADMSSVIVNFAKAFELQANYLLRRVAPSLKPADRAINLDGRSVDLIQAPMLSLGQLAHALAREQHLNGALKRLLNNGEWFTASLPPILKDLAQVRNDAAHASRISAARATEIRNRMMGVGWLGVFVDLGKVSAK